jgi:hypothetical protein
VLGFSINVFANGEFLVEIVEVKPKCAGDEIREFDGHH